MRLDDDEIRQYREEGYLLLEGLLEEDEIALLTHHLPTLLDQDSPRRVLEKDGQTPRSVYGSHQQSPVFEELSRLPRLVEPMRTLLEGDVYLYQFKINAKLALKGDVWEWHQDYVFWREEDGLPEPQVCNVVIFLDEVTELNGPMFLLRGSHREGVLRTPVPEGVPEGYEDQPEWISNLTADLKYSVPQDRLGELVDRYPPVAPKGGAGSVLLFHPNVVHGSAQNLSPFDRRLAILTYSHVDNRPTRLGEDGRPEFIVTRDFAPIQTVQDDALRRHHRIGAGP